MEIGTKPDRPFTVSEMVTGWHAVAEGLRAFVGGDPTPLGKWVESEQGRYCQEWAKYLKDNPDELPGLLDEAERENQ